MPSSLRHIFFDLDHTLWDFETNSNDTLAELFDEHQLAKHGLFDLDAFMTVYRKINHGLWDSYNRALVTKEQLRERRFRETFSELGLELKWHPEGFSDQYIARCTDKPAVFQGAHEVLGALSEKYTMSIITNGFPESQLRKMHSSKLLPYFSHLTISEEVGFAKPHPGIFAAALSGAGVRSEDALMVGDNLYADIEGARGSGISAIWFNTEKNANPNPESIREIHALKELLSLI